MKMPKRLIASLGVLMLNATPLLYASADQRDNYDHGGPPRHLGPVRQTIHDNHGYFVRGAPPPPGIHLERGRPLPHGYCGERLDNRGLGRMPQYPRYEWRRAGGDIVLIAAGTGIVYEMLDNVLN